MQPAKQRLLIYHPAQPRSVPLTYDNLWDKGGFSGTETAYMEIGKLLVDSGRFEVTVVVDHGDGDAKIDPSSGICFLPLSAIDINDYEWYCPLFFTGTDQHHVFMRQIRDRRKTKLLVWLHCFLDNDIALHHWKHEQYQVFGMAVSRWILDKYIPYFDADRLWLVPNGVSPRFHEAAHSSSSSLMAGKERGMWCFHQTFSRGGHTAARVFEQVRRRCPDAARGGFHTASYYTPDEREPLSSVHCHGSLSKMQLAEWLSKAEYFAYPLVHPESASVNHDTYCCAIVEALAMGVIVVTWGVACIPSLYGDLVVALPPPTSYPANNKFAADRWFLSDEAVSQMADAVVALEADPGRKAEIRRRGIEWARRQTWDIGANVMLDRMILPKEMRRRNNTRRCAFLLEAPLVAIEPAAAPGVEIERNRLTSYMMEATTTTTTTLHDFITAAAADVPDLKMHPLDHVLANVPLIPGVIVECGVFSGASVTKIATACPDRKVFGFDSFEGLPESWARPDLAYEAGAFSLGKQLPSVPGNVELRAGWFDATLPVLAAELAAAAEPIALLHVDCDLYSSTKTVFDVLGPHLLPGTIIVFDELFNYPTFEKHEIKAFFEFGRAFEWIGKNGAVDPDPQRDNGYWDQPAASRLV